MDLDSGISLGDLRSQPKYNFLLSVNDQNNESISRPFDFGFSPYQDLSLECDYYNEYEIIDICKENENLAILSLNIQSLSSKFDSLSDFLNILDSKDVHFDIICMQEIWQIQNPSSFTMDGFHPLI